MEALINLNRPVLRLCPVATLDFHKCTTDDVHSNTTTHIVDRSRRMRRGGVGIYLGSSSLSSGTALVRMMTEDGTDSSHTEGSKWPPRGREEQVLLGTAKSGFQMGSQGPFTYYTIPKGSPKLFLCSSSSSRVVYYR